MRWRAKRLAGFYVTRNEEDRELSAGDIAAMAQETAKQLATRVQRQASTLTGTPPYWAARSRELAAMIRQLGTPHAFITHSAADIQWPDLHKHMPGSIPDGATEAERQRINSRNINENPAIAAEWFYRRWNHFFKEVLRELFGIQEWWFRFEWQHRGSSHVHGLIWLKDAPSSDNIDLEKEESIQTFINYWEKRVSCINPGQEIPRAPIHPSAASMDEIRYDFKSLAEMINRVQKHTWCTTYCLRRPKGSAPDAPLVCRFKFLKDLAEHSSLMVNPSGHKQLVLRRNDPLLNSYNPVLALGWRANTDISPCTDSHAVRTYISKYASKSETPSAMFNEVMHAISAQMIEDTTSRIVFQKMMSRIIAERDYSAQEVCHALQDCKMYSASREFGTLCLQEQRQRRLRNQGDQDDVSGAVEEQDWHDAYLKRSNQLTSISLYEWFQWYRKQGRVAVKRSKSKVINLWPLYYPGEDDSEEHQNWCQAKVLLHQPHTHRSQLKDESERWSDAYKRLVEEHPEGLKDTLPDQPQRHRAEADAASDSGFSENEEEDNRDYEDWQVLAGIGPNGLSEEWDGPMLGAREMDVAFDWHMTAREWGEDGLMERVMYIENEKKMVRPFH